MEGAETRTTVPKRQLTICAGALEFLANLLLQRPLQHLRHSTKGLVAFSGKSLHRSDC